MAVNKNLLFLVLGAALSSMVSAYYIQGVIDNKGARGLDYSNTKVLLNGGQYQGFVDNMGNFKV